MSRNRVILLGALAAAITGLGGSWAAEPPAPGSREVFEADLSKYLPYFQGWLGADLQTVAPEGAGSRWTPRLTVDGTYTDNVDRTDTPKAAFSSNGSLGLSWLRRSPRLDASLEGRYTAPFYRSDALEGRELQTYGVAGAGRWQAGSHLSFSAGGNVDRNAESGVQAAPEGVRSSYQNRYDNYNAHAEYSWRPLDSLTNTGYYQYHYRNYRSGEAEGDDTRSHAASSAFQYRPDPADTLSLGYTYGLEETLPGTSALLQKREERTNHKIDASWAHRLRLTNDSPLVTATLAYALDRALYERGDGYSNHGVTLGWVTALSPRTDAGAHLGFQWLLPGQGEADTLWNWGLDFSHRFTAYTQVSVSASRAWEYARASSRTERTTLTDVQRLSARVTSLLARYWDGTLEGVYEYGKPGQQMVQAGGPGDYWLGQGSGSLRVRLGEKSFAVIDARVSRRSTDKSADDYWLYGAGVSYQLRILDWLSGTLRYSYDQADSDPTSTIEDYRENRIYASLTVAL